MNVKNKIKRRIRNVKNVAKSRIKWKINSNVTFLIPVFDSFVTDNKISITQKKQKAILGM